VGKPQFEDRTGRGVRELKEQFLGLITMVKRSPIPQRTVYRQVDG
jgi:hypothetical protein